MTWLRLAMLSALLSPLAPEERDEDPPADDELEPCACVQDAPS